MEGTKKLGSLVQIQFCEGECDLCMVAALQDINTELRTAYPWWFGDGGNLLTECMDVYTKKCRAELAGRTVKKPIWQVVCGFCDEPFGVCAIHLQDIVQKLEHAGLT